MSFWNRVEHLRREQNTSYRWLALKMGISETTVSSMRHSNTEPRATEAVKIAAALGTTVEYLSTGQEDGFYKRYMELKASLKTILSTF